MPASAEKQKEHQWWTNALCVTKRDLECRICNWDCFWFGICCVCLSQPHRITHFKSLAKSTASHFASLGFKPLSLAAAALWQLMEICPGHSCETMVQIKNKLWFWGHGMKIITREKIVSFFCVNGFAEKVTVVTRDLHPLEALCSKTVDQLSRTNFVLVSSVKLFALRWCPVSNIFLRCSLSGADSASEALSCKSHWGEEVEKPPVLVCTIVFVGNQPNNRVRAA